jgi:hypothetical protein
VNRGRDEGVRREVVEKVMKSEMRRTRKGTIRSLKRK